MDIDNNSPPTQRSPAAPLVVLPAIREDHPEAHVSPVPALTHSNVTSESASKLARAGQDKWKRVENRLRCTLIESILRDVRGVAIFTMQLTYPRSIKEQQCIDWASRVEERKRRDENRPVGFRSTSYVSWVNSLPDSRFEESDPFDIREMFRTLLYIWDSHEAANARKETKEAEIRLGVDAMIELAFQFRYEGKHTRRAEVDLFLPALPWAATADNVCMIDLPSEWGEFLTSLPNYHIFCADTSTLAVITFASEAKIKDEKVAARQLTYDLCSGQHQRRALGFDDSKLYGAILVDKLFRIYESEWSGDTVRVFPTNRSFDLGIFDEFLSCYITLCRLADFEASNVKSVFDKWNSEQGKQAIKDRNIAESQKTPWRKESPPSASGGPNKRRRGSGEDDDMESLDTYDLEQFEDDVDVDKGPAKVPAVVEEEVPPGGDPLNERNLRVLEYLTRTKHLPGSEVGDVRTQDSAVSCGGMAIILAFLFDIYEELPAYIVPLLMMRQQRIPRKQWVLNQNERGKNLEQIAEGGQSSKHQPSITDYTTAFDYNVVVLAACQGKRHPVNIGLGVKRLSADGVPVQQWAQSQQHKITAKEIQMLAGLQDDQLLSRFIILLTIKESLINGLGQPIGFDLSRIECNPVENWLMVDGQALTGWDFRLFRCQGEAMVGEAQYVDQYQICIAVYRGHSTLKFSFVDKPADIERLTQYFPFDRLVEVMPKLLQDKCLG